MGRRPALWRAVSFLALLWTLGTGVAAGADHPLPPAVRAGDRGPVVVLLQDLLHRLGFLDAAPDGRFGPRTARAVEAFQRQAGLQVDGIVGSSTWERLLRGTAPAQVHVVRPGETLSHIARRYGVGVRQLAAVNGLADPNRIRAGTRLTVPGTGSPDPQGPALTLWSDADTILPRGAVARVIDVRTGKSFAIRRLAGTFHADVEPLTRADTETMRQIYGGRWSWERRAIILEVDGKRYAASMNGQPHGRSSIGDNGFPGHFCIHLLGSRTHGTRRIDGEHHRRILEAAGYHPGPGEVLL